MVGALDKYNTKQLFEIRDIWPIVWRRKWLVIIPWVFVSLTVFFGSKFLTPEYRASAITQIDRNVRLSSELRNIVTADRSYWESYSRSDELRGYHNELLSAQFISQLAIRFARKSGRHAGMLRI